MRARKAWVGLAALTIAGLAIGLLLEWQRSARLGAENAALSEQAGELAALRAERQQSANQLPAAAETARLRDQQVELLRLRGEVTRLRNELRQDAGRGATASPPAAVTAPVSSQPETAPAPFTGTATVSVGSGETFATGGWLTSPGSRTFLLATPQLADGAGERETINIPMCLLKVAEGDLPESLLRKLQSQAPAESLALTGTEAAFLNNMLNSTDETNIVSRPRITTSDGTPANLFVGQVRPNPDGTQRQIGTRIGLSPEIAEDGQTIKMAVKLEYVPQEEKGAEGAPGKAN
jgi:hypothetical protein